MSIKAVFKKLVWKKLEGLKFWHLQEVRSSLEDQKLLLGRMASWQMRKKKVLASLQDAEFKVSSQWGQDGIIDWLIKRACIPLHCHSFIEFGVENYRQSNTRFLLQNRNWRGLILDGSPAMPKAVEDDALLWSNDLTARSAFITRENINGLIAEGGMRGEIGLLSVDVDGNDYWIWEAIDIVQPILVVCEFNSVFGDVHPISVPYDPSFHRTAKHYTNLYFGASVMALKELGEKKGYRFVGTNLAGNDAFFVREDYAMRFVDSALMEIRMTPSKARESKDPAGKLTYLSRMDRLLPIVELPVVNTKTGVTTSLGDLLPVYSEAWERLSEGCG